MFKEGENSQGENNQPNTGDPGSSSDNLFADKLGAIKNENGEPKYKDVESALEALAHSQQFIETLKAEKKDLEEKHTMTQAELERRESVEDAIARLTNKNPQDPPKKEDPPNSGGVADEEMLRNLLAQELDSRQQQQTQESNFSQVQNTLIQKYGDKAPEVIRTRAKELNTTTQELETIARTNPQMALNLLGGGDVVSTAPSTSTQAPPRSNPPQELKRPDRSVLRGGSTDAVLAHWRDIQKHTHEKLGIDN